MFETWFCTVFKLNTSSAAIPTSVSRQCPTKPTAGACSPRASGLSTYYFIKDLFVCEKRTGSKSAGGER
jgi:hypothetical protein